jgi:hypothetical protein
MLYLIIIMSIISLIRILLLFLVFDVCRCFGHLWIKEGERSQEGAIWRSCRYHDLAIVKGGKMIFVYNHKIKIQSHGGVALVHVNPTRQRTPQSEFVWGNGAQGIKPSASITWTSKCMMTVPDVGTTLCWVRNIKKHLR